MTTHSGWCIGPTGARIEHQECRYERCECPCHKEDSDGS